jgi:acyl carrier protein
MDDKLRKIISEILAVAEDLIDSTTSTETQPKWDSLRHMNLILAIEDEFSVRFSDEEIPLLTSVAAIEKALAKRS